MNYLIRLRRPLVVSNACFLLFFSQIFGEVTILLKLFSLKSSKLRICSESCFVVVEAQPNILKVRPAPELPLSYFPTVNF
jgi:hypothetical protein